MILDWLTQDLTDLLSRDARARIVLWCDAKAEFRASLPELTEHLAAHNLVLLGFDPAQKHGALWLKWAAEAGPGAGQHVVLWLPCARDALSGAADGLRLDCLWEYTFSGLTWLIDGKPPTLFGFLKKHGVPLPTQRAEQDAVWRGGPDSALAKYVRANLDRDAAFWTSRTLSLTAIEENIVGNVEERLLRLLADPSHEWAQLVKLGIAAEFQAQVDQHYAPTAGLADDAQAWAEAFVTSLALMEVYEATGQPIEFPYPTRLPPDRYRATLRTFWQRWLANRDQFEIYVRWAQLIEPKVDLRTWARTHAGQPQAFKGLAADRWGRFRQGLIDQGSNLPKIQSYLQQQVEPIQQEARGFWASATHDLPGWALTLKVAELIKQAERAAEAATHLTSPAELVAAYAEDWHHIDLDHWQVLAAARQADDLEPLAAIANRVYERYLDAVNRAFYDAFRVDQQWPPIDCRGVADVAADLYRSTPARRAILMVDALRYDLAAALQARLGEGELTAYVANVPSDTYVGMTSLLPPTDVQLRLDSGKPQLWSEQVNGDLCFRPYRWRVLEAAGVAPLSQSKGARQDELHHLWAVVDKPRNLPPTLLLFDRGLDEVGHGTGYELIGHFEELLKDIERAIRRLRSWGYTEIEIVTDHGFVLLPSSANVQLYQVDKGRFALLTDRSGFLPRGEPAPVATVPFALDPNWSVALAPGLRSFAAPGAFFHGGATLQEVVVPHLKITSPVAARPRLRARAVVPQVDIATLSVRVELVPEHPVRANMFEGEPEAIRVRVFLGTPTEPRSTEKIVTLMPDDAGSKSVTLFLQRDPPIMAGTEIAVQAFDADTDEAYATGLFVRAMRDLD